ncbi:GtrA family protein [Microbacterium saperdae]
MIVLIPAYEPDERMRELLDALDAEGVQTVVVDDGSGAAYSPHFDDAARRGATVLHLPRNQGKARALRRGLTFIAERWPGEDVVTADSDGQHRPSDILAVAAATVGGDALVLGGRSFRGTVPVRSRFGNAVSRGLFRLSGGDVHDTQTGLRGIPSALIADVVAVAGERFAWEMKVLLEFTRRGIPIREVPIATVYLDDNASSHFRPLRDSLDVLRPMLRYVLVSFGSFVLDVAAVQLLYALIGNLLLSAIGARLLSATVNFTLNRSFVFRGGPQGDIRRQVWRYAALALALLAGGYASMALFIAWGVPVLWAKLLADTAVYACGFLVQRGYVFVARSADRVGR